MAFCPQVSDPNVVVAFNNIVTMFDGTPLKVEEFKSLDLRKERTGADKEAMDIAYNVWDITKGENLPETIKEAVDLILNNTAQETNTSNSKEQIEANRNKETDSELSRNENGEVLAPNGNVSKLYKDIEQLEEVTTKQQAEQLYKQTRSKEFKDWFGDSKVVDENGEPLIVYHGSPFKFNYFKKENIGKNTLKEIEGFYFSFSKEYSKGYYNMDLVGDNYIFEDIIMRNPDTYGYYMNLSSNGYFNIKTREFTVSDNTLLDDILNNEKLIYEISNVIRKYNKDYNFYNSSIDIFELSSISFNNELIDTKEKKKLIIDEIKNNVINFFEMADKKLKDKGVPNYNPTVYPVFLSLVDPIEIDIAIGDITSKQKLNLNNNDGLITKEELLVKEPNQIKSVLNQGTFSTTENNIYYQNNTTQSTEDYIASEKTIRDLAARMSDRIGIPIRFESDRTKKYKGKLENNTAHINLAYATLDTPIHEILGHSIIRAIKDKELYNNLLKELETGKGKEVLDRIKRDYQYKQSNIESGNWEYGMYRIQTSSTAHQYFDTLKEAEENIEKYSPKYTLEEQQEEAIVELLGMMTAEKLDVIKDGKLISLLKRLLKEIKSFVKDLLKQKEIEIDKLPDNMTLGDLSDLLAYSNSKLILPGYEVEYTTPDNMKFKTYSEANNHISKLVKSVKDVDLSGAKLNIINQNTISSINEIKVNSFSGTDIDDIPFYAERRNGIWYLSYTKIDLENDFYNNQENVTTNVSVIRYYNLTLNYNNINQFIEKNKEYEQSKEIIDEWKRINNIVYNPEEVYSRGQGFYSVVGAYSSFDVNLMFQNLLTHLEDHKKVGGEFVISAFTKPIDKNIGHLEGGGGKIKFKIFPQSNDIKWAANRDVFSGSVWDASEKINKDKKSEILGVSYTKAPSMTHINSDAIVPNLADVIDKLAYQHNELGIQLTGNNFRLEYDEDIPYQTKKLLGSLNNILEKKFGKLIEPEISKKQNINKDIISEFEVLHKKVSGDDWKNVTQQEIERHEYLSNLINKVGIQPTQTNENLKENIESVKGRISDLVNTEEGIIDLQEEYLSQAIENLKSLKNAKILFNDSSVNEENVSANKWFIQSENNYPSIGLDTKKEAEEYLKNELTDAENFLNKIKTKSKKEYNKQALINTKLAALKEVAKKYPRSLIRSEVKQSLVKNTSTQNYLFEDDELPFQRIQSETQEDFQSVEPTINLDIVSDEEYQILKEGITTTANEIYDNRIKALKNTIAKHPDKQEKYNARIQELQEAQEKLKEDTVLNEILTSVEGLLSSAKSDLTNDQTATGVMNTLQQLASMNVILEMYANEDRINNQVLKDKASDLISEMMRLSNVANALVPKVMKGIADRYNIDVSIEDLKIIPEEKTMNAIFRGIENMSSKLVATISKALDLAERLKNNNLNKNFIVPFNKILKDLKDAKVDINSQEVIDSLMQEDKDGNQTKNYINEYSDKFWSERRDVRFNLGAISKYKKKGQTNIVSNLSKKIREYYDRMVYVNPAYFYEDTTEEDKQEIYNKIVNEIGIEKADKLIAEADKKYATYLTRKNDAELRIVAETNSEQEQDFKIGKWIEYNSPENFMRQLNSNLSIETTNGSNWLVVAPKKQINGKNTGLYDTKYEKLYKNKEKNKALIAFFEFTNESLNKYKKYFPHYISDELNANFLPEVFQDLQTTGLTSKIEKIKRAAIESVSETREGYAGYDIRDHTGKKIGTIPTPYTKDTLTGLKKKISTIEKRMKNLELEILEILEITPTVDDYFREGNMKMVADKKEKLKEDKEEITKLKERYNTSFKYKSTDLVKTTRLFAESAENYKAKAQVEDIVLLGKTALQNARELELNDGGKPVKLGENRLASFKNGLQITQKAVDHAIESILYENRRDREMKSNVVVTSTPAGKQTIKEHNVLNKELKDKLSKGEITKDEFNVKIADLNEKLMEEASVRKVSGNKIMDLLQKFTYISSLGWNPYSAISNLISGRLVNSLEASSGQFFSQKDLMFATNKIKYSFIKSLTGRETEESKKIKALIDKYGILFNLLETDYGNNGTLSFLNKKESLLNPMEMQKRGEYINQGTTFLSMMNATKITDLNGKEYTLWEAYDTDGKLKPNFDATEWENELTIDTINGYTKFRDKVIKLNKKLHGNYASPVLYKKYAIGRAVGTFRSWLPEAIASRFEPERDDSDLGTKVKGRYRSYAKLYEEKNFIGALRTTMSMLVKSTLRMKVDKNGLNDVDYYNMKRNIREIQWGIGMMLAYYGLSLILNAFGDEDDEEKFGIITTMNMLNRAQGDISLYLNPTEAKRMIDNPFPMINSLYKVYKIIPKMFETASNDDKNHDIMDFGKYALSALPGTNVLTKTYNMGTMEY